MYRTYLMGVAPIECVAENRDWAEAKRATRCITKQLIGRQFVGDSPAGIGDKPLLWASYETAARLAKAEADSESLPGSCGSVTGLR